MARIARIVVPGVAHHVTQRGNRRQGVFFDDDDYRAYIALMAESCAAANVAVWAYCLMPNHVHLIAVPRKEDGLRAAVAETHRRYALRVNGREGWRGHFWQERFASFPMDEDYLIAAARYVELNPVRARIVRRAENYRWSSAGAHLAGKDDALVAAAPLLERIGGSRRWRKFLEAGMPEEEIEELRRHGSTGRPLGDDRFIARLERRTGRALKPQKRGRKKKAA